jgi:hypothetical protein
MRGLARQSEQGEKFGRHCLGFQASDIVVKTIRCVEGDYIQCCAKQDDSRSRAADNKSKRRYTALKHDLGSFPISCSLTFYNFILSV